MAFSPAFTSAFSPAFRPAYNTDAGGVPFVGLLELYGGASAAYSLRRLLASVSNVVRVRRESDNNERDFNAKEVSNGILTAWVGNGNDGFVETWYDQSGNGNDASQSVAGSQPKIVNAGSLITRGTFNEPSISFGTLTDKHFNVAGRPTTKSVFSTLEAGNTNFESLVTDTNNNSPRITTNNAANNRVYSFVGFGTPSVNINGSTYNGTSAAGSFNFHLLSMTSATGESIDRIGANAATGVTANSFDFVSELILYPSDQSTNRAAIEENINNQYDIY
jgi:hypothetical protein